MKKIIMILAVVTAFFIVACSPPPSRGGHVTCYTGSLKIIDADVTDVYVNYHGMEFTVNGIKHETTPGTSCIAVRNK